MLSEFASPHIRCCLSAIPSDLMKSTAVDESLSSMNQQFCSRENQLLQMLQQNEKSTQIYIRNYLWDTLEINWDKIKLAFNSNEIKLPKLVMIKMQDKIRVRRMMSREM